MILFLPAHEESALVGYGLIFAGKRIFIANNTIIANITIAAGSAADQSPMKLLNSKKIAVAHKWQHVKKIVFFRKFRIGTLRKMISCSMVFFIIRLFNIYETCRIFYDVTSVSIA